MNQANTMKSINPGFSLAPVTGWIADTIDAALNWLFSLTHAAAANRNSVIWLLFTLIAIILTFRAHTPEQWSNLFNLFRIALTNPAKLPEGLDYYTAVFNFLGALFWNPSVIRHMLALYAPFWLMHHIAAIYLADVFEKDLDVAEKFVIQAAFGRNYNTIRIREGKIVDADQSSQIVEIGGPGYVTVELDSAVLFEKPDGTSHVIVPTINEPHDRVVVDGFERIRQAADLRDVIVPGQDISARSRDGILITAKGIQYSFSIYRGENPTPTLQTPYPMAPKALEDLVYKTGRTVKPGSLPSSGHDWLNSQPGKNAGPVAGEFSGFIGKRGLSDFLVNVGAPEEAALRNRQQEIDREGQLPPAPAGQPENLAKPSTFASRSEITAMFYKADGFKKTATGKGLQVNWIGVGTWDIPAEIIPANHLGAWKISRDNFIRSNENAIKTLREESKFQEYLRLVQTMPIGKFYKDLQPVGDDSQVVDVLLRDYYERLQSALELCERRDEETPPSLKNVVALLKRLVVNAYGMGEDKP